MVAGLQEQPAVMKSKADDLLHVAHDAPVADPVSTGRK